MTLEITEENYLELIENNTQPIILDFLAQRCGPCKIIAPYFDELAVKYENEVTIGKIDVDSNQDLAYKFGIRSIPTVLFINNGTVVDKQIGATSKKALEDRLRAKLL